MSDVEFLQLGDFDPTSNKREFDAVSFRSFFWKGMLRFETVSRGEVVVYSSRQDPLGEDYALRPGKIEEVIDPELAKQAIAKAIVSCFDHTITAEALSDGKGGWIPLETDT